MARPGPKRKNPTKFDRQQVHEDVKTLFFQGHSLADAARIMGVEVNTAKTWSAQGRWSEEIQRIKELAIQRQPVPTTAQKVAFDLASTNRETRSLLARGIHKAATHIAEKMEGEDIVKGAIGVKAIVGAAKEVDGSWGGDGQGQRFAVAINLREIANTPGMIRELTSEEAAALAEGELRYSDGSPVERLM